MTKPREMIQILVFYILLLLSFFLYSTCETSDPYSLLDVDKMISPSQPRVGYPGESWLTISDKNVLSIGEIAGRPIEVLLKNGGEVIMINSSEKGVWQQQLVNVQTIEKSTDLFIDVAPANQGQTIKGWGGAFNEKGWFALKSVSERVRNATLSAFFDVKQGIGFNLGRIPIGSSDYALSRYSLAEEADDWAMSKFSIERDRQNLIPYIKAAQAANPSMLFWASAWSPPAWMKDNGKTDSGKLLDDPKIYEALALYQLKFCQAYQTEGVPITYLAIQNEPTTLTAYPSCEWSPDQFKKYVSDYIGPLLKNELPSVGIMLGTINMSENWKHIDAVLQDPKAEKYVDAIGLQWDGNQAWKLSKPPKRQITLIQTETDCGNWPWKPGYNPEYPSNDFTYAAYTWHKVKMYLDLGVTAYELWNLILDQSGKSIDSRNPWPQNSPVVVDTKFEPGTVYFTPLFFAFGQLSKYAPEGSKYLKSENSNTMVFLRPDGALSVFIVNEALTPESIYLKVGDAKYNLLCPSKSFSTVLLRP